MESRNAGRQWVLASVTMAVVVGASGVSTGAATEDLGAHVVALLARSLELTPPATIPAPLRNRLSQGEIEDYETEGRFVPGILFFEYPLAKSVDRKFYREAKAFWALGRRERFKIVPYLTEEYMRRQEPLKGIIWDCITDLVYWSSDS